MILTDSSGLTHGWDTPAPAWCHTGHGRDTLPWPPRSVTHVIAGTHQPPCGVAHITSGHAGPREVSHVTAEIHTCHSRDTPAPRGVTHVTAGTRRQHVVSHTSQQGHTGPTWCHMSRQRYTRVTAGTRMLGFPRPICWFLDSPRQLWGI